MSVLACQRFRCESIMCDHHSYEYGYICRGCLTELVARGAGTDIGSFMQECAPDAENIVSCDEWEKTCKEEFESDSDRFGEHG